MVVHVFDMKEEGEGTAQQYFVLHRIGENSGHVCINLQTVNVSAKACVGM